MNNQTQPVPHPSDSASEEDPQLEVLSPPGAKTRKTRNGKIARLPKLERDMVCRMLRDGIEHERIVAALDEVGITVAVRNVSNWKTGGGYQDWCDEQDQVLETQLRQDALTDHLREDPTELPEVGLQTAATCYSQLLLHPEMQEKIEADPKSYLPVVSALCRVSKEILAHQKYRDDCQRRTHPNHEREILKQKDREAIELTCKVYSGEIKDTPPTPKPPKP